MEMRKEAALRRQQVGVFINSLGEFIDSLFFCFVGSDVKKKIPSQHKVRISLQDRTLDSMFPVANPAQIPGSNDKNISKADASPSVSKSKEIKESECFLTSVADLRKAVVKGKHTRGSPDIFLQKLISKGQGWIIRIDLTEILESHIFVGIVDLDRCLSLLQHSTKLFLVNHGALAWVFPVVLYIYSD
jgi:DNA mismatch repair protein MLH1